MNEAKPILALNRFEAGDMGQMDRRLAELVARRYKTQGRSSVIFYQQPLEIVRAAGVWMYDAAGKAYLDMYNNVPSVGHSHPRVVAAMTEQAARFNTNSRYLYENLSEYAEALLATFPASLSNVVFACTGSESNDIALRIATAATGKKGFIVTETAYHGNTSAVMAVSPSAYRNSRIPDHVRTVPAPDAARLGAGADLERQFAVRVQNAIDSLNDAGIGFAGLLVDTIFSSDGVFAEPAGFLRETAERVHRAGGLFIADEVQPGFGRTGSGFWGFGRHGLIPDIVTLGKPMGNGFPMAGVVTRPDLLDAFCRQTEYFNTFGGNPVAAATGLAVLQVIHEEQLIARAESAGARLRAELRQLAARYPVISDVRGAGMFNGIEFRRPDTGEPDEKMAAAVINALKDQGVLIGAAGARGNTLKIRPPLCFSLDNAAFFLDKFDNVMAGLAKTTGGRA
ncbi:aspartate aminotransferase family protein [Acerihabitans sp. KWT182]|uniref:Aspartate aminotransferase family protein n=1 Tax=Acerihabitans sp. KWT182 TaxID=3157919 RepID=A0AAU7Q5K9_9GAMM